MTDDAPWWFTWCVTRMLALSVTYLSRSITSGDPEYYMRSLARAGQDGWSGVLPEYPLPIVVALWPLHLVAEAGVPPRIVVAGALLLVDLGFCVVLRRRRGDRAAAFWMWGVLLAGPVALQRLDIVPGVLLGASLLAGGPRARGVLLALGTAAKIFPVAGLPSAVAAGARGRVVAVTTLAVGGGLGVVSVVVGGWDRLLSPLTYQSDRGLQVESVAATPLVLLQLVDRGRWVTAYSPSSKSFEVTGPGEAAALALTDAAQVVLVVTVVALAVLAGRARRHTWSAPSAGALAEECLVWSTLAAVGGLIVTSRVFSPQYVLWLLPIAAVARAGPSRFTRRWTAGLLVALGLTQLLYPLLYGGILGVAWTTWPASGALLVRNVIVVALTVAAVWRAADAARGLRSEAVAQADSTPRVGGGSIGRTSRSGGTRPP